MPSSATCSRVDKLFTPPGSSHPCCPFTSQELVHGSSDSTFEQCHWVPKHLDNKVRGVHLELDDNAGNIFPTVKIIEQNVELYQHIPNLSLRFKTNHNDAYDTYIVEVNPSIAHDHLLRISTHVKDDSSEVLVLFPKVSRPFIELHFRVFCTHHSLTPNPCYTIQNGYPRFEELQAQVLFGLIMLDSPFTRDAKQATRKSGCNSTFDAPELKNLCATYPERQLTKGQAAKLVGQTVNLSSDLFPKCRTPRHFMEAYIAKHNLTSRSFDMVFPAEADDANELHRFKREYRGNARCFGIVVYTFIEAAIIKYGDPLFVQTLETQFAGAVSKRQKKETLARSTQTQVSKVSSSSTQLQVTNGRSRGETHSGAIALPPGIREKRRVRVYWTSEWFEGSIASIDEENVFVRYDDCDADGNAQARASTAAENIQPRARAEFVKLNYTLVGVAMGKEDFGMDEDLWMCLRCQLLHRHEENCERLCCAQCKGLYREVGAARPLGSERPSRKRAATSNKQTPRVVEIPTLGTHTTADASTDAVGTSMSGSGTQVSASGAIDANPLSDDDCDVTSMNSDTDD